MSQRFEHLVLHTDYSRVNVVIKDREQEGWELCGAVEKARVLGFTEYALFFKRPIQSATETRLLQAEFERGEALAQAARDAARADKNASELSSALAQVKQIQDECAKHTEPFGLSRAEVAELIVKSNEVDQLRLSLEEWKDIAHGEKCTSAQNDSLRAVITKLRLTLKLIFNIAAHAPDKKASHYDIASKATVALAKTDEFDPQGDKDA